MTAASFENDAAMGEPDDDYRLSTDVSLFDIDAIHAFLSGEAYWSRGVPRDVVERALANSVAVGAFAGDRQVGLVRAVTDKATFAWVCDVYVLEAHRGRGLAKRMMSALRAHPEMQGLRRWVLATRDAHELYRRLGFTELPKPERWMVVEDPEVYARRG